MTREEMIAAAKIEHDKVCHCDPRYLMSCGRMAEAILSLGRKCPLCGEPAHDLGCPAITPV